MISTFDSCAACNFPSFAFDFLVESKAALMQVFQRLPLGAVCAGCLVLSLLMWDEIASMAPFLNPTVLYVSVFY